MMLYIFLKTHNRNKIDSMKTNEKRFLRHSDILIKLERERKDSSRSIMACVRSWYQTCSFPSKAAGGPNCRYHNLSKTFDK